MKMTSNRPYLLRAFYDWIVDNQLTPHIVVDATVPGVRVPTEHIKDGQIVLNISPTACGNLQLGNEDVEFNARFSGASRKLLVPCEAIMAIYARENGAGTIFTNEEESEMLPEETGATEDTQLESVPQEEAEQSTEAPKRPPKGKPSLTVVK